MHLLECFDEDHTWASLDEYEGLTIDLGVEAKLSEFHTKRDMSGIAPTWLLARGKQAPLRDHQCDVDDGLDEQPLGSEPPPERRMIQCEGDVFMRNRMPTPEPFYTRHTFWSERVHEASQEVFRRAQNDQKKSAALRKER